MNVETTNQVMSFRNYNYEQFTNSLILLNQSVGFGVRLLPAATQGPRELGELFAVGNCDGLFLEPTFLPSTLVVHGTLLGAHLIPCSDSSEYLSFWRLIGGPFSTCTCTPGSSSIRNTCEPALCRVSSAFLENPQEPVMDGECGCALFVPYIAVPLPHMTSIWLTDWQKKGLVRDTSGCAGCFFKHCHATK